MSRGGPYSREWRGKLGDIPVEDGEKIRERARLGSVEVGRHFDCDPKAASTSATSSGLIPLAETCARH